jgi:outer membrane receptor protein involved in Fe transport
MRKSAIILSLVLMASCAHATIFGSVRGLAHDPQHRPVAGAKITVTPVNAATAASATLDAVTDQNGEFLFPAVPIGDYIVSVSAFGFAPQQKRLTVSSGSSAQVHFPLAISPVKQEVTVTAEASGIDPQSSTSQTTISRQQIERTPGATAANSVSMITENVPGAYVVHDQLHIRGGHQVSWLLDGVPVPNTNIASNVGPQFDPKDIDVIEMQRGGYSAEYGDRTYGVFNVITRSGFERNREGEVVLNYGNLNTTNDQISFGDHTDRFAYFSSFNANRTDLGLETPTPEVLHDMNSGLSGFTSLIFNATPTNQLRLVASVRGDHYQVPNTPDDQLAGTRDTEVERDSFANFSWVHTGAKGVVFTVSPFYHFNRAALNGGPNDSPVITNNDRGSNYAGGVINLAVIKGKHSARFGVQAFGQRDNSFFGLTDTDGSGLVLNQRDITTGQLESIYLEDQYKATTWLTFNAGLRLTHFGSSINENAADPRVGAAVVLPKLHWALRGFYGRYYQAPPLSTVSGPLADLALSQGFGFLPLRGERDEQHEFGIAIPFRGWSFDFDHFRTGARNFFDHDALGNSNIFLPLTLAAARIRGYEATVRSPRLVGGTQVHLSYSRQWVQGRGGVSGGLTDFSPPADNGYFYLDHDQRDTLSVGASTDLPGHAWVSATVLYGSGFLAGDGPDHLPPHTTFDISLGKNFAERWTAQFTALNLGNNRYLLDESNTFGGTHFVDPRRVSVELRYRFRY